MIFLFYYKLKSIFINDALSIELNNKNRYNFIKFNNLSFKYFLNFYYLFNVQVIIIKYNVYINKYNGKCNIY